MFFYFFGFIPGRNYPFVPFSFYRSGVVLVFPSSLSPTLQDTGVFVVSWLSSLGFSVLSLYSSGIRVGDGRPEGFSFLYQSHAVISFFDRAPEETGRSFIRFFAGDQLFPSLFSIPRTLFSSRHFQVILFNFPRKLRLQRRRPKGLYVSVFHFFFQCRRASSFLRPVSFSSFLLCDPWRSLIFSPPCELSALRVFFVLLFLLALV